MSETSTSKRIPALLLGWWALLGLANLFWLNRDTLPPSWDPFNHLLSSLRYYHVLQGKIGDKNILASLLNVDNYYPPLAPLATSFFYFVLPSDPDTATWTLNQFFLGILILATYQLGSRLYTPETGLFAAVAMTSFPAIMTQTRIFMLDLPVTAMTTLGIYLLWRTKEFQHPGASVLFGLVSGLAMLTKWSYLFFIVLPMIYTAGQALRNGDRLTRGRNILAAFVAWDVVAGPWFIFHLSDLAFKFVKFGYDVGVRQGNPEVFTSRSFSYYASVLPGHILFPWLLFFLVGSFFYFRQELKKEPLLLLWIVGGYVILTLLRNKNDRYILPFLPAVALIATGWLKNFPWSLRTQGGVLIGIAFYCVGHGIYTDPPRQENWPLKEAFDFIQSQKAYHPNPRVRMIPDVPYFERHGFEYYAEAAQVPLSVATWVRFPTFTDFVVTKTGEQGVQHDPAEIMEMIQKDPAGFEAVFKKKWERALPDGSTGRIYVRDITPVSGVTPAELTRKFESALLDYIGQYVKEPAGWTVRVIPFSDPDTLMGRFRTVSFAMDSALIGRKSKDGPPLIVRDLGMELSDLTINPYKLLRDGELEIISLMEAKPRFRLTEADANRYLSGLKSGLDVNVEFQEGQVKLHTRSNGARPSIDLDLGLELVNAENMGFEFSRVRVAGIWLPSFIPQILTSKFNPILKPMPCRMRLQTLRIEDGNLVLNGQSTRRPSSDPLSSVSSRSCPNRAHC